jgi:hypothetical protein
MFDCRLAVEKPGYEKRIATFFKKISAVVQRELQANISSLALCKFQLKEFTLHNDGRVSNPIQDLLVNRDSEFPFSLQIICE